jgi:hypothetical protein
VLQVDGDGSLNSAQGFEAYQVVTNDGTIMLVARALNFFHLARQSVTGRREVYSNVGLEEPRADLFLPPAVAVDEVLSAPRAQELMP